MYTKNKINRKEFFRLVIAIALPIACQNLLTTTASMVDTIMIGSQGELSVAAVGICSQIGSLFFASYFGFAGGAMMFFSQYWGAEDEEGINRTFGIALLCMLAIGLLFGGVAVTKPAFILGIYTDKQSIIEVAVPYMQIVGFAYPLQVIAMIVSFPFHGTCESSADQFSCGADYKFCIELDFNLWTFRHAADGSGRRGGRYIGFRHS